MCNYLKLKNFYLFLNYIYGNNIGDYVVQTMCYFQEGKKSLDKRDKKKFPNSANIYHIEGTVGNSGLKKESIKYYPRKEAIDLNKFSDLVHYFYKEQFKKKSVKILLDFKEGLRLKSNDFELLVDKHKKSIHAKMSLGFISVSKTFTLDSYPTVNKLISSEKKISIEDIHYFIYENKANKTNAILLFPKTFSKETSVIIEEFVIFIFENKKKNIYHIENISGIIICTHGRAISIKINSLNLDNK